MSSTVTSGGFEHESSSETAAEMVEVLKPKDEDSKKPVVLRDKGKDVEPEQAKASEAARELGKRGGEASAKAAKEKAKAEPEKETEAEPEKQAKGKEAKGDEPEKKPGHPRHDPEARIQQLANQRAEEKRRNDELAARLERLEAAQKPKADSAASETRTDPNAEPKLEDFAEHSDWVKAVARFEAKQEAKRLREEARAEQEAQESARTRHESRTAFLKRLDAFPDQDALSKVDERLLRFTPVSEQAPGDDVGPDNLIGEAIKRSENPGELMLYLSQNQDEVIRLLRCGPWELPMELGKLEARFGVREEEPERKFIPAQAPLRTLTPSAQVAEVDLMAPDLGFDKFMAAKKKRA